MQEQMILPSKRRVDTHGITAPFDQLLLPGEVITEALCTVTVFSGTDLDPSHMLEGICQIRGDSLYQQIKLGEPGVIYLLVFTAETDLGNTYAVEARQAVLEDQIPAGPIYQYLDLSSTPYPYDFIEGFDSTSDLTSALELVWPIEAFDSGSTLLSGDLYDLLIEYTIPTEAFDSTSDIQSGTLDQIYFQYEIPTEAFNSTSDLVSGDIYSDLITYSNYPPEGFDSASTIVSGTLS